MKRLNIVLTQCVAMHPSRLYDDLYDLTDFHIYFIARRPMLYIKDAFAEDNNIILVLYGNSVEEKTIKMHFPQTKGIKDFSYSFKDATHATILANYTAQDLDGNPIKCENVEYSGIECAKKFEEEQEYEVLYIGKSYGKKGNRNAKTRLLSHATLEKIALENINGYLELFLFNVEPVAATGCFGLNGFLAVDDVEERLVPGCISLSEAVLINKFKPKYNDMFKDGVVPSKTHDSYKSIMDENYDSIEIGVAAYGSSYNYELNTEAFTWKIEHGVSNKLNISPRPME